MRSAARLAKGGSVETEDPKPQQESEQQDPYAAHKERTAPFRFKKGQSGNPAGSSAKARLRAAFERVFDEPVSQKVAQAVAEVAADPNHQHWSQAIAHTSRIMGLVETEKAQEVVVTTEIEVRDRPDGTQPRVEVRNVTTTGEAGAIRGDSSDVEEVELP